MSEEGREDKREKERYSKKRKREGETKRGLYRMGDKEKHSMFALSKSVTSIQHTFSVIYTFGKRGV